MRQKDIFTITVTNWDKYNSKQKTGHKKTFISNNFCSDAKMRLVPVSVRWMFLGILLTCGDHARGSAEMSESHLRDLLESSWSIERALDALQQLQLLSYSKNAPLNTLHYITIQNDTLLSKRDAKQKKPPAPPPKVAANAGKLIALYCELWKARYKSPRSPDISAASSKQFKNLLTDFGENRAALLISAYLQMPDSWYVTKKHDVWTLIQNIPSVALFADSGKIISRRDADQLDLAITTQNTLDALRRGEI